MKPGWILSNSGGIFGGSVSLAMKCLAMGSRKARTPASTAARSCGAKEMPALQAMLSQSTMLMGSACALPGRLLLPTLCAWMVASIAARPSRNNSLLMVSPIACTEDGLGAACSLCRSLRHSSTARSETSKKLWPRLCGGAGVPPVLLLRLAAGGALLGAGCPSLPAGAAFPPPRSALVAASVFPDGALVIGAAGGSILPAGAMLLAAPSRATLVLLLGAPFLAAAPAAPGLAVATSQDGASGFPRPVETPATPSCLRLSAPLGGTPAGAGLDRWSSDISTLRSADFRSPVALVVSAGCFRGRPGGRFTAPSPEPSGALFRSRGHLLRPSASHFSLASGWTPFQPPVPSIHIPHHLSSSGGSSSSRWVPAKLALRRYHALCFLHTISRGPLAKKISRWAARSRAQV
mmetsp:Transcript_13159/g.33301  ORF Transcript_13159/g.33301 Transcript_13159/m.33301 type:complete len:406 (-) Transcript_13159:2-1219(-)